jgi:hypothetical protein
MDTYALLDKVGGWLVNLVVWNGDASTWQPSDNVIAQLASEVDFANLPVNPNTILKYNAEEWLKNQGYDATQLVTFTDMERQLAAAGKASFLIDAVRNWANNILAEYVANPISKSDWPFSPYTFNEAITDGFNVLNS